MQVSLRPLSPAPVRASRPGEAEAPAVATSPPRAPRQSTRAERLSHWARNLQSSTLANLRFGSAAFAGQMVGMVVGAAIFTPLALSMGNPYVLTGGTALVGGAVAMGGYFVEKLRSGSESTRGAGSTVADAALGAGTALKAMPRFLYPSLMGATGADRQLIMEALDRLPMGSVTSTSSIQVIPGLENTGALGICHPLFSQNRILLDRAALGWFPGFNHELVSHEVGHARDFARGYGPFGAHSLPGPFGSAPFVTEYAQTNRFEDFAETHAHYHMEREALARATPEKFQIMDQLHRQGLTERFTEQPAVRDAGRSVGQALERVPYLREGLELAAALVGPLQVNRGAAALEEGLRRGDPDKKFQGKMTLATGALLMNPGWAPAGLAVTMAQVALA
ncbi:MAG: hypothetical protein AB1758_31685, partial [Candidatus Eremiobacterota bacterium]